MKKLVKRENPLALSFHNPQTSMLDYYFGNQMRRFDDLFAKMDSFWDIRNNPTPGLSVQDKGDVYVATLPVADYKDGDVEISLDGNTVHINGKYSKETDKNGVKYSTTGSYSYTYSMPEYVEKDKIVAEYSNGCLVVSAPILKTGALETKKIPVSIK